MLRSILSNAFFSFISDIATRLASALLLILVARTLGESAAGVYTLSTNYTLILTAIVLWGLDQILIRDVARNRSQSGRYFTHFFIIRLVVAPILWLFLAALLFGLQPYHEEANYFIALAGGTLIGSSIANLGQSLLIVQERVWLSALVSALVSALLLATSAAAISYGADLGSLALILVLGSWLQAAVLTGLVHKHLWPKGFRLDFGFCWHQLVAAFPFIPIALFIALENQLGGILLSMFHTESVVGFYGMANVIVAALALLSQALRIGVFPVMARLHQTEHDRFVRLYERSWRYLSILSLPMVILVILFSEQIVRIIYRQPVLEVVTTLRWLAPTLFFYFVNIPNARLMILDGQQKALARLFAVATGASLLIGLFLIPRYGAPAVAITRVFSMSVLFTLSCVYVNRYILAVRPWRFLWKPLAASAMMASTVFVFLAVGPIVTRGLVGVAVYCVLLVLMKAIPAEEWMWLRTRLAFWVPRSIGRG